MNFLKPSVKTIVLAFFLLVFSSLLWRLFVLSRISDTFPVGFPFQFFLSWGPCQPGGNCSEFNGLYLVFDVVIWYVVAAWVIHLFQKRTA